jgi:hypothetical protein
MECTQENWCHFFSNWTNRIPYKSLSFKIVSYDMNSLNTDDVNMKIIKKYIKLGGIKKFKVTDFDEN